MRRRPIVQNAKSPCTRTKSNYTKKQNYLNARTRASLPKRFKHKNGHAPEITGCVAGNEFQEFRPRPEKLRVAIETTTTTDESGTAKMACYRVNYDRLGKGRGSFYRSSSLPLPNLAKMALTAGGMPPLDDLACALLGSLGLPPMEKERTLVAAMSSRLLSNTRRDGTDSTRPRSHFT